MRMVVCIQKILQLQSVGNSNMVNRRPSILDSLNKSSISGRMPGTFSIRRGGGREESIAFLAYISEQQKRQK